MANQFGYCFVEGFTQIDTERGGDDTDRPVPDDSAFYFPSQCPDFALIGRGEPVQFWDYQTGYVGSLSVTVAWQANPALIGLYKKVKADYVAARDNPKCLARCYFWYFNSAVGYIVESGVMADPTESNFTAGGDLVGEFRILFRRVGLHANRVTSGSDQARTWDLGGLPQASGGAAAQPYFRFGAEDFNDREDWYYG